jgi:hypothetical protein
MAHCARPTQTTCFRPPSSLRANTSTRKSPCLRTIISKAHRNAATRCGILPHRCPLRIFEWYSLEPGAQSLHSPPLAFEMILHTRRRLRDKGARPCLWLLRPCGMCASEHTQILVPDPWRPIPFTARSVLKIILTGPGSCSAPRTLTQDPRARPSLSGI